MLSLSIRRPAVRAAAALALSLLAAPAGAHDLWLTLSSSEAGPQVRVNFGHARARLTPAKPKLLDLTAITPDETKDLAAALKPSPPDVPPALLAALPTRPGRTLVAASYDSGYWVRQKDGSGRNTSRRMRPDAEAARWSMKFAKAAFGPSAPWQRVVGHILEIVPLEVPGPTAGALRVRVLFRGAPLAGAALVTGEGAMDAGQTPHYTTDQDGIATVPIRQAGAQLLTVTHAIVPSATPELADRDEYSATFAFRLDEAPVN
ncbi:DUF4198 domain-containing protein [Methylobacterium isbiliense]|jgi:uncharacterized GH25 family protein|uniref:Nickel uptake substrate-specific transmembrane region n=1 Tax=Methylobacterium isbiliense TaxID=315478 RepID=A0ABQ4SGN4_9HYPH|nr:DUF4198 domain-containing protein [Methylobacterium isbiliense]MDN3627486.1 DUF4198 domain-containing protein [Methylobacterium isbiliense]GJE01714.1 hypothetical protein GMJLKIPL_3649 [Methylobacterium isbiliense]